MRWALAVVVALFALGSVGWAQGAHARGSSRQREVLVFYATGRDAQISITGERELPRLLNAGLGGTLDYYSEYLDTGRFPDAQYQEAFREFLRLKYHDRRFDLIIAVGDAGLEFLADVRDGLFPGTPIAFFSRNPATARVANSAGLVAAVDYSRTVALAMQLEPDTTRVFVVSGAAQSDRAMEGRARAQFQQFGKRLTFTYLSGLPTGELEQRLAALPEQSIVLYLIVYQDGAGENFHPLAYLDRLAAVSSRPIYSWVDSTIGRGVVGGSMQRQQAQIEALAALSLRVLHGEQAAGIPVSAPRASVNQVDWRQLRRWGISEGRVPADTQVLFREPGIWDRYRLYIVLAGLLVLGQTALIAGLLAQAARRRRAEDQVRKREAELRTSYERIRDLGSRLIGAQEAERAHLARELHDDVGQQATLLAIELEVVSNNSEHGLNDVRVPIRTALDRTHKIAQSVHDLSHRLHPPTLQLTGPVASLKSLQREFSRSNVSVTLVHRDVPAEVPHDLTLCLFRIVQEALQNAVKHGRAREVWVNLTGSPTGLKLVIADNGVGFDVDAVSGEGLGLISMSERLEPFGGTLKIDSRRGAGTCLEIGVPFRAEPAKLVAFASSARHGTRDHVSSGS